MMNMHTTPPQEESLLRSLAQEQYLAAPYALYRQFRDEGIIYDHTYNVYVVLDPLIVQAILKDPKRFSSHVYQSQKLASPLLSRAYRPYITAYNAMETLFIFRDGEMHRRLRTVTARFFSRQAVASRREQLWSIAGEHLEHLAPFIHEGPQDACQHFTIPFPLKVMSELLGIPTTRESCSALGVNRAPNHPLAALREWSVQFATVTGYFGLPPMDMAKSFAAGWSEAHDFFEQVLDAYRQHSELRTRGKILCDLIELEGTGSEQIRPTELASTCLLLYIGGVYNTANALASALRWLLHLPLLRRETLLADDEQLHAFIASCLYHDPSAHWIGRVTQERTNIGETWIAQGQGILLCLASSAEDVMLDSTEKSTMKETFPFGHGSHYCIGADLAGAEIAIGLRAFFERFPIASLDDRPLRWHNPAMRGLEALWVHI
jgi:cytochrome P450